jgi:hypothetical protein
MHRDGIVIEHALSRIASPTWACDRSHQAVVLRNPNAERLS